MFSFCESEPHVIVFIHLWSHKFIGIVLCELTLLYNIEWRRDRPHHGRSIILLLDAEVIALNQLRASDCSLLHRIGRQGRVRSIQFVGRLLIALEETYVYDNVYYSFCIGLYENSTCLKYEWIVFNVLDRNPSAGRDTSRCCVTLSLS